MARSGPISAAQARSLALRARRNTRERAQAKARVERQERLTAEHAEREWRVSEAARLEEERLVAELAERERRANEAAQLEKERLAAEQEAERQKAAKLVRATAKKAVRRIVDRCFMGAVEGKKTATILLELDRSSLVEFNQLSSAIVELLDEMGFSAKLRENESKLIVSWASTAWECCSLDKRGISIGHLSWLSSNSGQGLLQNLWMAIANSADRDALYVDVKAVPMPGNQSRWGDNFVHKLLLKRIPIGVLPTPILFFTKTLKRQGYECFVSPGPKGTTGLRISW